MQACRRFSSPASALLRRNVSLLLPPRIVNNDLRVFLFPRFQSTVPSSVQNVLPDTVNAPIATLPAPLELPEKESGMSMFTYLLKTGKGYLSFYKTGLKNVYHNFIATRPIQDRIDKAGSITALVAAHQISRSEFQLVMRSRHDTQRIPVFAVVFLIFGEFSPLVLPFVSFIVPWNCRIPKQLQGDREKQEQRTKDAFAKLSPFGDPQEVLTVRKTAEGLDREELLHVSNVLGLHSLKWPGALSLPPTGWLRWKVKRRIEYLELDDTLLERGGGPTALDVGEELKMAVVERGMDTIGKNDVHLREELKNWFAAKEKAGGLTPALWLTRPSKWFSNSSSSVEPGQKKQWGPPKK